MISLLMMINVSDIRYMIIPNRLLVFFLPLFVCLRLWSPDIPWYDALLGAATGFLLIWFIIIISKGGMGAGDMKMLAMLGIILGFSKVLLTFFIAALLGSCIGIGLILFKKVKRKEPTPFAPYLVVGALVSYFHGDSLIRLYLSYL
jgi:leader peptidase (prepilin peptidase)/N-methyltransferase